jgi:hypothetical protein
MAPLPSTSAATPTTQQAPAASAALAAAPPLAVRTKAQQIDALVKTGKPADLFAAYKLVRDCVSARNLAATTEPAQRQEWHTPSPAEACGDITNAQTTSARQWLDVAAMAGVRDSALAYAMATQNEPPDADHVQRMLAVFDAGAKLGDAYSLIALSNRAEEEKDWSKALTYWTAANEAIRRVKGRDVPNNRDIENRLAMPLTPDQRTAALEAGKRLALTWSQQ